jgi:hypothetical protein
MEQTKWQLRLGRERLTTSKGVFVPPHRHVQSFIVGDGTNKVATASQAREANNLERRFRPPAVMLSRLHFIYVSFGNNIHNKNVAHTST